MMREEGGWGGEWGGGRGVFWEGGGNLYEVVKIGGDWDIECGR